MAKEIIAPEITKEVVTLASEATGLAELYAKYEIKSNPQYEAAADDLKKIKAKINELEEKRKSITIPMDTAKSRIMEFFRVPVDRLKAAEGIIKQCLGIWQDEQEKIRQAKENELRKIAEEQERKEKARLAAIAAKEAEKAAELRKRAQEEQDKAKKAKLKADAEAASAKSKDALEEAAQVHVDVPVVVSETPEVSGIVSKTTWTYEIVDETLIPRTFLMVDEKKLSGVARATKGTLDVPGVRFFPEKGIAASKK